jgi:hypothetical protein
MPSGVEIVCRSRSVWLGVSRGAACGGCFDRGFTEMETLARFQQRRGRDEPQSGRAPRLWPSFLGEAAHVAQVCREPMASRAWLFNNSDSVFGRAEPPWFKMPSTRSFDLLPEAGAGPPQKHRSAQSRTEEQRCGENFPSRLVRSVFVNLAKTSKSLAVSFAGSLALSRLHRCSHPTVPGRC